MINPQCPHCNGKTIKKGKTTAGYQRYYCKSCKKTFSDSPNPQGSFPQGDRALTNAERQKKWRQQNKEHWKSEKEP